MGAASKKVYRIDDILDTINFTNGANVRRSIQNSSIDYVCSIPLFNKDDWADILASTTIVFHSEISTNHILGIYLEVEKTSFLIYGPIKYLDEIQGTSYNQSTDSLLARELQEYAAYHGLEELLEIDFELFISLLVTFGFSLAHVHGIDFYELEKIKLANTFARMLHNFQMLQKGESICSDTHIEAFSWIYFLEYSAIAKYFHGRKSISIHDTATNTCHFPILLGQICSACNGELQLSVSCSDINIESASNSISSAIDSKIIEENMINIFEVDLTKSLGVLSEFDVIVANDVLEHFQEEQSFLVLENIWRFTKEILIIHVPLESVPVKAYGHFTSFDRNKLARWADLLPNCNNITNLIISEANCSPDPNIGDGFLMLKKISNYKS